MKRLNKQDIQDIFMLTPMQEGMFFHYLKEPNSIMYCEQLSLEVSGEIDNELFRRAWDFVINTNEMLRIVFRWEKLDNPTQVVLKEHSCHIVFHDFSNETPDQKKSLMAEMKESDRNEPFNLQEVPFRVILCKIMEKNHEMVISNHHIIYDGWSNGIILKEFFRVYNQLCQGQLPIHPLKTSFKEFIKWIQSQDKKKQVQFWREYLSGIDTRTELSIIRRKSGALKGVKSHSIVFENEIKKKLDDFTKCNKVTVASIFYTAWGMLLQKYCNNEDITFGTTVSGRSARIKGIEEMVGLFINTIPLRIHTSLHDQINDLVMRTDKLLREREAFENTPLLEIKGCSSLAGIESLFDTIVAIENYPLDNHLLSQESKLSIHSYSITERTHYDLSVGILLFNEIEVKFSYPQENVESERVEILACHFKHLVQCLVENTGQEICEIEILSINEKNRILYDFNNTDAHYPANKTIHQLFEEQVERTPDHLALVGEGQRSPIFISYKELNCQSGRLAELLRSKGVLPDTLVGIMMDRSVELVMGIIGILKSGSAYLPVNPDYPQNRIHFILNDSSVKILVTRSDLFEKRESTLSWVGKRDFETVFFNPDEFLYFPPAYQTPPVASQPSHLAYVIYTSGSTGKPKGVLVEHRNVVNVIHWFGRQYKLHPEIHILLMSDSTFDASIDQIFGALLNGASLYVVNKELLTDIDALRHYINKNQINLINFVPALLSELLGNKKKLESLHTVISGAERLEENIKNNILKLGYNLSNHYGPTEGTIDTLTLKCSDAPVSLGKPIANVKVHLLDKWGHMVPVGVPGELCIFGAGLARGYLNRPELTSEKFVATVGREKLDPFYRSGDLGRWLTDGNVVFLGRIDQQVKLRGFRIELEEIVAQLLQYPAIKEAVIIAKDDIRGEKYLCAYIVPQLTSDTNDLPIIDIPKLTQYLSETLPDYMIPSYFVQLAEIPLLPSGKTDSKALADPIFKTGNQYEGPRNETERKMAQIWSDILSRDTVIGINDNFFHIGGHSLKATSLTFRIQKVFNVKIPLMEIFNNPTISKLANYIHIATGEKYIKIEPVEQKKYYALSSAQKRLYFLQQMEVASSSYNMSVVMTFEGELDRGKFEKTFKQLIQRHESLRTSFEMIEEEPHQTIHDDVEFKIAYFNLPIIEKIPQDVSSEGLLTNISFSIKNIIQNFIHPFDLSHAPLMRVGLIKEENTKHHLLVDIHHIIVDGTSTGILQKEFMALYEGKKLPPLTIRYQDYAEWQASKKGQESLNTQGQFWFQQFEKEIPVLNLPVDFQRPIVQSFEGNRVRFELTEKSTTSLKALAMEQGVTLFMLLLAICTIWLSKLSGEEDVVIGSPVAGRRYEELQSLIGMFVNTLALRNYPKPEKTIKEFLKEVKRNTIDAFQNQDYPFENLVDHVTKNRDTSRNPIFDVMFVFQNMAMPEIQIPDLVLKPYEYEKNTAKFDLNLEGIEIGNKLLFNLEYSTKLFNEETILRFSGYLKNIMASIISTPDMKIANITMLEQEERQKILDISNGAHEPIDIKATIHGMFEKIALTHKDKIALVFGETRLTYGELNRRAHRLATMLRIQGIDRNCIVGLMVQRSFELVIGMLAIMKAGGAYLAIDPNFPQQRKQFMIQDSHIEIVLTNFEIDPNTIDVTKNIRMMDIRDHNIYQNISQDEEELPNINKGSDIVYVIFTSGSTGNPKGVMLEHTNLVNLIEFQYKYTCIDFSKVLQFTTISFDVSFQEIFSTLLFAGELYLINEDMRYSIPDLFQLIVKNKVKTLFFPMSFLKMLFNNDDDINLPAGSIEHIVTAGEQVVVEDKLRNYLKEHHIYLHNHYGPSETHVVSTLTMFPDENIPQFPAIGKPVTNTSIYILDKAKHLQPTTIAGELNVAGLQVGRGYLYRNEETQEKFIENIFPGGGTLYRTGDLARWLANGNIEFLGRVDHQVKIRGIRIEPGEIESHLKRITSVKDAVVVVKQADNGEKYLCAYVVSTTGTNWDESTIRNILSTNLPDHMIPAYFISLDKIPLTPSGKIDRKALPDPEIKEQERYVAPRTLIELRMTEIWVKILAREKHLISINDNFFHLGGHSLKAMSLVAKIHKIFNVKIPLAQIFKNPTIKGISDYIKDATGEKYTWIEPTEEQEYYTLSSAQNRLFFLQQMDKSGIAYNLSAAWILEGLVDKPRLESSIVNLIQRHESFRTSFDILDEKPVQRVQNHVTFEIQYYDNPQPHFIRPFELSKAPLLRVGLVKLEEEKHIWLVDMHHIISDGMSMGILVNEFTIFFSGTELPALNLQYKDYAEWQNREKKSKNLLDQETYWIKEFETEIPILDLPIDYSRPLTQSFEGNCLSFELSSEIVGSLKAISVEAGATLYMVLLSLYNIFLSKISNREDIVIGTPIAGRRHADLENIIGMFVNTLALRNYPSSDKKFIDFLAEVKVRTLKAFENQEYQYEYLVEKLTITRDTSHNPLFDTMFVLQNTGIREIEIPGLKLSPYTQESKTSKFDLSLAVMEVEDMLALTFEYSTKLFNQGTIERFITYFLNTVSCVINDKNLKIVDVEIISSQEKNRLLYEFNNTAAEYPHDKTVHQLFEEQAERTPGRIAVINPLKSVDAPHGSLIQITYHELNEKSTHLAHVLQSNGAKPDIIIGIMVERSVEMIIGILGILKSSGAYLPVDPGYPLDRRAFMLEDSSVNILLSHHQLIDQIKYNGTRIYFEDETSYPVDNTNFTPYYNSSNLAYVIYTSGSTGKPKGVTIDHRGLMNRLIWMQSQYPLDKTDTILQKTSFTFDVSVWELLWWAIVGAKVSLLAQGGEKEPKTIVSTIERDNVTIMHFVPSMLNAFLDYIEGFPSINKLASLKQVIASGEELTISQVKKFNELLFQSNGTHLANLYGPTEASIDVSYFNCPKSGTFVRIPIGKPIHNIKLYVVGKENCLQPIGVPGELCIAGDGLARGYLNRPQMTHDKFTANPFTIGEKMYRTGDLARWTADGNVEFFGRIDHQVKIRGFRIELGEIENRLFKHPQIKEAVVVVREDAFGDKSLVAYYVSLQEIPQSELRECLLKNLPEYMIPSYFMRMESIPLTSSGKVNRRALPQPELNTNKGYEAPLGTIEEKVVEIWTEVLIGKNTSPVEKRIGRHDNFFQLGGHSLKIIVTAHKIREKLGVEIALNEFFSHPTVAQLASYINAQLAENTPNQKLGQSRDLFISSKVHDSKKMYEFFPLTHIQEAYLLGRSDQFDIGDSSTHGHFEWSTHLDIRRFNDGWNKLIARHPVLRSKLSDDGKQHFIEGIHQYEIQLDNLIHCDVDEQRARILRERDRMSGYVFDLTQWPLFEIKAMQLSEKELYFMIKFDMIMFDGHSLQILTQELTEFYINPNLELPPLDFTFRDYILAAKELKDSDIYQTDKEYWLNKLEDFPPAPQLPLACKPSEIKQPLFKKLSKHFSKEEWTVLQEIAQKNNTTPSVLLSTAFAQVLAYWSNQRRFAINVTLFNRFPFHKDVEKIVGNFTTVVFLEVEWDSTHPFLEMVQKIHHSLMEALEHCHYDGIEFLREINRSKNLHAHALMPIVFTSIMKGESQANIFAPDDPVSQSKVTWTNGQISQVYLEVHTESTMDQLDISWDFVEELFTPATITAMFEHYINIITELTKGDKDYKLELPQRTKLLWEKYNSTAEKIPASLLHQLFQRQVALTPEYIALEFGAETMTYISLDKKSNQVAAFLRAKGVKPNDLVSVLTSRSLETMVYVMGILKAGGAYVPIDPDFPKERQDYICKDSNSKLLMVPHPYENENMENYPSDALENINTPLDIAYVIYTSGSTGRPKGVIISHQEAANTIIDINQKFNVNETDRIMGISSMCFDLSVYDVFGALSTGARLVLIPTQKDIDVLTGTLDSKKITFWNSVPAILDMMVNNLEAEYVNYTLTRALLSGDWIPLKLPEAVKKHFPNCEIISAGGATEGSIWSIYYPVKETLKEWNSIPYGYPLANQTFYVLNDHLGLCPEDVPGELFIGGVGVAEGYINDVEKTSHAFLNHPDFGRIYRTGDFGVFRKEGYIEFQGRKDSQVKIRGHRIELGEIETCILEYSLVKSAIVAPFSNNSGAKQLCAYILTHPDPQVDSPSFLPDLRAFLSQKLPDYMVPSIIIPLQTFPLTGNGKIDFKALPIPGDIDLEVTPENILPRNDVEKKIAEIWSNILGKEDIHINDNFFMSGGDSIKAIQVAAQLKRKGYKVGMKDFFQYPSIAEMALLIKKVKHVSDQSTITGTIPLSPIQKYFFEKVKTDRHHFNQAVMLFSKERFTQEIIETSFQKIQQHHDALRMTFHPENNEIVQNNHGLEYPLSLEVFDFQGLADGKNAETEIENNVNQLQASILLHVGPLLKLRLFHLDHGDYLLIVIHHLVIDGISWRILLEDFETAYKLLLRGQEVAFPLKTTSYKEWVEQLYQYANSKEFLVERNYWETLEQTPVLPLPQPKEIKNLPLLKKENRGFHSFELSVMDTEKLLTKVGAAYNTEINDILLTALGMAVHQWTGAKNALIALEGHGREELIKNIDITRTIGWFTSFYPVILDMNYAPNIPQMITCTKDILRRIPNKGVGYGILTYLTSPGNKTNLTSKLKPEIVYNYLGQIDDALNSDLFQPTGLSTGDAISPRSEWIYSLDISGIVSNKKFQMVVKYNTDAYSSEEAMDFTSLCEANLRQVIEHCAEKENAEFTFSDFNIRIDQQEADLVFDILSDINLED